MLLEIAVIIGSLVQLAILYHCNHFKGQLPVMAESFQNMGNDLNENAVNAMSILEDMIELLEQNPSDANIITTPNPNTGESLMGMLTNQVLSNIMSPSTHGRQTEIQEEDQDTKKAEIGN
jgi:hypothetical protein